MKVLENGTNNTINTNSHNKAFNLNFFLLSLHLFCIFVLSLDLSTVQTAKGQPKQSYKFVAEDSSLKTNHCCNVIVNQDPPKSTLLSHQWCSNAPFSFSMSSKRFLMHYFSDTVFAKQHGAYGSLHRGGFQRRLSGGLFCRLCVKTSQMLSHSLRS